MRPISIGGFAVGGDAPPLVIAEIGINHNGDLEHAKRMIDSARLAGAALVKLQSFQPENFMKSDLPYHDNIRRLSFSFEQHEELFAFAQKTGAKLFSAAFDAATADFLDQMGAPAFKIASMDCNNLPLLRHVAKKGKPVILATGMAGMEEVDAAVQAIRGEGNGQLILLHCVSDYPTNIKQMNLNVMRTLAERFDAPVGLSDHSEGLYASFAAAAMGAAMIERHFTMDRKMAKVFPFSDHAISIEPDELEELACYCRSLRVMQGNGEKVLSKNEAENRNNFRRGLFAGRALRAGETITPDMLIALRPVRGLSVAEWDGVIGKKTRARRERTRPAHPRRPRLTPAATGGGITKVIRVMAARQYTAVNDTEQTRIKETAMPAITENMTINEVIKLHPGTMKVFNKFKVDSCCGGAQSIAAAAAVAAADVRQLLEELNTVAESKK